MNILNMPEHTMIIMMMMMQRCQPPAWPAASGPWLPAIVHIHTVAATPAEAQDQLQPLYSI
jgi:hypothetical protein